MYLPSSRRRLAAFVVCLTSVAVPSVAGAATPGAVSVRVEGAAATLVPPTTVTTTTAPIDKAGHACSGTSAGGALERATAGDWSGPYTFAQIVETVKGETHAFSDKTYWALWVNGKAADSGACDTELQPGDSVLFYAACGGASSGCYAGEPLVVSAPSLAAPGAPFTVSVTESSTSFGPAPDDTVTTASGPSAGATVTGGGLSARTGADGKATLAATQRGPLDLTVTKPAQVPQTVSVCITDGSDGLCGTTDKTPPAAAIKGGLREQARFTRANAPSALAGTVATDASGLKDVRLRLTRTKGPRCSTYDGARERFVKAKRCGVAGGRFFSVGAKADWSYLLPFGLPAGRYVLDVQAVDRAGNSSKISTRGRDRIVFVVK